MAVLYNIGEAEYQLQDYASALTTFERYLTEAGTQEGHRGEVESTMDVLRARVGHLTITTSPPGAEVTVDDQPIGRTPFDRSLLVSIGRRKVVASMAGRAPVSRYVDVAADDNAAVSLQLGSGESPSTAALLQQLSTSKAESTSSGSAGPALRTLGWVVTAASAVGAEDVNSGSSRSRSRTTSPPRALPTRRRAATPSPTTNLTTDVFWILADSLTAAAVRHRAGSPSILRLRPLRRSSDRSAEPQRRTVRWTRLSVGPGLCTL